MASDALGCAHVRLQFHRDVPGLRSAEVVGRFHVLAALALHDMKRELLRRNRPAQDLVKGVPADKAGSLVARCAICRHM